jgi:hypothetical protein
MLWWYYFGRGNPFRVSDSDMNMVKDYYEVESWGTELLKNAKAKMKKPLSGIQQRILKLFQMIIQHHSALVKHLWHIQGHGNWLRKGLASGLAKKAQVGFVRGKGRANWLAR